LAAKSPEDAKGTKTASGKKKRKRIRWTHFLSVPLQSAEDQQEFLRLKRAILERLPGAVPEAAFISQAKFHMTLCLVQLNDDEATAKAREVIKGCIPEMRESLQESGCVQGGRLLVPFAAGLATFPGRNVSRARVVFRNPSPGCSARSALQDIAKMFIRSFEEAGVTCSSQSEVELHATVINVRYAGGKDGGTPIDAAPVLDAFSDWPARTYATPELHLSVMGAPAPDGNYPCAMRVPVVAEAGESG
jgi:hypothetical protein